MTESDKDFVGSIPEVYDEYLVPLIFESYAQDLAARVVAREPLSILETAAGSGVVPRALIPVLPENASYMVTDLNQPMLDQAANRQDPDNRVTWQEADALALPFSDASFDVVACQFGVMFYPDRDAGYVEAYRVIQPGGALIFNVWDRIETNDFANTVAAAAAKVFEDDPPQFLPRTPHGYCDESLIRAELERAGFSNIEYESLESVSRAPSPRHPAIAYCQGTPLRNEIEQRDPSLLGHVTDRAANAIADKFGTGAVEGRVRGYVITAER